MGEQRPAPGAHRIVGAATEEDMLARRERTRLEQAAELVGATVRVNPDPAEVRPERPFHRGAQGDRGPAGRRRSPAGWPGASRRPAHRRRHRGRAAGLAAARHHTGIGSAGHRVAGDLARHPVRRTLEAVAGRAGLQFGQRAGLSPGKDAVALHAIAPRKRDDNPVPRQLPGASEPGAMVPPRDPGPFSPELALSRPLTVRQG